MDCKEGPRRENMDDELEYDKQRGGKERAELTTMMMRPKWLVALT